jgi:hypothetical protein
MGKNTDREKVKSHKRNGIFLTIAGIAALALGIWDYQDTKSFLATAKTTTGKVTEVKQRVKTDHKAEDYDERRKITYDATINYVVNNKKYDLESESSNNTFSVGETVTVYYDPENPDEAKVDEGGGVDSRGKWIMLFGLIALIGGIVYFVMAKKAKKA